MSLVMEALNRFIDMGGYGGFIWAAYAAAALVLILLWLFSWRSLRRSEGELAQLDRRLPGRKGGQGRTAETARGQA
jgi:heme exporter protein D